MNNITPKHVVVFLLGTILIVPMLNLAHLYGTIQPDGINKELLPYILGPAFEVSVVVCLWGNQRIVGIFFAILSLVYGMLHHINFDDIREFDDWYKKSFLVPAFVQFGISSLSYFLAEYLVYLIRLEKKAKSLRELSDEYANLERKWAESERWFNEQQQTLNEQSGLLSKVRKEVTNAEQRLEDLKREITSTINSNNAKKRTKSETKIPA